MARNSSLDVDDDEGVARDAAATDGRSASPRRARAIR